MDKHAEAFTSESMVSTFQTEPTISDLPDYRKENEKEESTTELPTIERYNPTNANEGIYNWE